MYQEKLERRNFALCRHFDISSLLLLRKLGSAVVSIKVFSSRHSLHDFAVGLYGGALPAIDHLISKGFWSVFKSQIYFERLVFCLYFSCLKERVWFLNLSLKVLAAAPR